MAMSNVHQNGPSEIMGYAEPWIVAPGEKVKIKHQKKSRKSLQASAPADSSRPDSDRMVDDPADAGFVLVLNEQNTLDLIVGLGPELGFRKYPTGLRPQKKQWSKVTVTLGGRSIQVQLIHQSFKVEPVPPPQSYRGQLPGQALVSRSGPLTIAATRNHPGDSPGVGDFFNGRIDGLTLQTTRRTPSILAKYDFSIYISTDEIIDVSGNVYHGVLINAPTRAVTGHDWDGSECDWTRAKHGYGAIHFHDDDLDDSDWDTDFEIRIPPNARSGAYAVEVETASRLGRDSITFFVRPTQWTPSDNSNKVCLVLPTFTYLGYANEYPLDRTIQDVRHDFDIEQHRKTRDFYKMRRRRGDLGLSFLDAHADGSDTWFFSSKRPLLNVRPGYIVQTLSRPHDFSADLIMIGFLEREGIPYEVLTDHDLHARGASCLQGFSTVITGSHPQCSTLESFNAYSGFAQGGGNLMYLGGNGFHHVSALDKARPHRLEVGRGGSRARLFTGSRGEQVNSLDGSTGGLWISRGMSCNTLFGIGFSAAGLGPGYAYRRTEVSRSHRLAWMFAGVSNDLIGEHGLGGGASGDGIDRFDVDRGSPNDGLAVLATSLGTVCIGDYNLTEEEHIFWSTRNPGTEGNLIRSDLVYYLGSGGGAVFSVGSMNWYCSLAWNNYNNDVARLTRNVIKGFLEGRHKKT
ncbi:hypothetical protein DHEL01_v212185 [Diaporthe helianthi]|uniref:N,N-dimethylformamidase beta subunit-like C-terminal domain-containing protein n=1 Tax=Diaporthe helianthi TaxID=158607 RepID=A0A2P5HGP3_DIAHE|nr:hypothetical protein DHEL01_v212185 [Diaporthe helianthi]